MNPMARVLVVTLAVALLAVPSTASATMSTSSDACSSSPYYLNVSNGNLILSEADGPIKAVISAIGERYTHSMLAHGNNWFTHSTMFEPGIDLTPGEPWLDEYQLTEGYPGLAQVDQGGLVWFLNGSVAIHKFTGSSVSTRATDWLWNTAPYVGRTSREDGGKVIYQVGIGNYAWTSANQNTETNWRDMPYVMYQYVNLEGRHVNAKTHKDGAVCSTSIAHAVNMSATFTSTYNNYGRSTENNCPTSWNGDGWCDRGCQFADVDCMQSGDYIIPKTYSNTLVRNASQALFDAMYATAYDELGSICWWPFCNRSNEATQTANQLVNCFAKKQNLCEDESDAWRTLINNGLTATSISPDRLIATGSGSPWAGAAPQSVRFSSAGNVYGCWF